jgi:hypothetical protein
MVIAELLTKCRGLTRQLIRLKCAKWAREQEVKIELNTGIRKARGIMMSNNTNPRNADYNAISLHTCYKYYQIEG